MRWTKRLCRFCSSENHPEFRFFYQIDDKIICSNCGAELVNKSIKEDEKITTLEVVKIGYKRDAVAP